MNLYYGPAGMIHSRYQPYTHYSVRGQQCYCPPVYNRKAMRIRQQPGVDYSVADYIQNYRIPILDNDLNLSNIGLTSLEGLQQIEGLENVRILNLRNNNLKELPAGIFNNLTNLKWLNLENNALIELPAGIFNNLTNLEWLNLGYNNLTKLTEDIFNGLENLQWLYLNNNQITHDTSSPYEHQWIIGLPATIFSQSQNLSGLDIKNNNLHNLPSEIFGNTLDLRLLDIRNNFFPGTKEAFKYTYLPNRQEITIWFKDQKERAQLPPK